jgi:acetyl-CoA carboxylase biotin carboxylase subunit
MFKKVLIANRGEIAVRLIRACRDLGISPVAVYSEADRQSLHVRLADEAYLLGPAPSSESYLAIGRIVDVARRSGCEAVHPGYGFLSENPLLAEACSEAGLVMVGPPASAMRLMASKTGARSVLVRSGVPVVPGTFRPLHSVQEAIDEAGRIGYPVMLKAAAGGGGKGMRLVADQARLAADFEAAAGEAQGAFGDASLYLEKYIARPRHIEIQILVDSHGNAVHLGERECSLQRRHQKVIEECPSPLLDEDLRSRMGSAAREVALAAGYVNAGTVEFLMDGNRNFYFLEMNTRLQVEHPVTELVTGIDIVREQFRIADGEPLGFTQDDVAMRGWALESRIYAEDPERAFFPSPGIIRRLQEPHGPGIRIDSGVYEGWDVPIHYDPLIAKLIAHGSDRPQAIARMRRALAEYRIEGIKTTVGFFGELLGDPQFLAGELSTGFIEEFLARRGPAASLSARDREAFALAAAVAYRDAAPDPPARGRRESAWKMSFRSGFARRSSVRSNLRPRAIGKAADDRRYRNSG